MSDDDTHTLIARTDMLYIIVLKSCDINVVDCGDLDPERLNLTLGELDRGFVLCSPREVFTKHTVRSLLYCIRHLAWSALDHVITAMADEDSHLGSLIARDWAPWLWAIDHIEIALRDEIMTRGEYIDQLDGSRLAPRHTPFGVDGARRAVEVIKAACAHAELSRACCGAYDGVDVARELIDIRGRDEETNA